MEMGVTLRQKRGTDKVTFTRLFKTGLGASCGRRKTQQTKRAVTGFMDFYLYRAFFPLPFPPLPLLAAK
jgi:hypothetical protein